MGIFYETILVRNILKGGEPVELTVKVDTGATMLVLPGFPGGQCSRTSEKFGASGDAPSSFLIFFRFSHQLLGFGIVDVLSLFQPFLETTF